MTIFIDSSIIIALLNSRDKNHSRAKELLDDLKEPKFGMRFTNDYVLDEVVTTLWMHTHRKSIVNKAYKLLRHTPEFVRFEHTTPLVLDLAWVKWDLFAKWPEKPLSFTDCCILSFIDKNDITYLATFDSDFSGLCNLMSSCP
ncbi:MAG: type II toxin-antitoxin system VapC family toxin [Candidatus Thorarchaeota archaeon]